MARYRVLIVDDDPDLRPAIAGLLRKRGIDSVEAGTLAEGWTSLHAPEELDAVVLDRHLPDGDGLDLLRRVKEDAHLSHLPVVLQTGADHPEEVLQGLQAGAYYYLIKPFREDMLHAVIATALQDQRRMRDLRDAIQDSVRTLNLMEHGRFKVRTLQDAHSLTGLLANTCPDPEGVAVGLSELIINAVVHGNLELSYSETTECLKCGRLGEEIRTRLEDPRFQGRWVDVRFDRFPGRIRFTVQDQGPGFDWRKYLEFTPDRIFDNHGRGIAMAKASSFDSLTYRGRGNVAIAEVRVEK
jgi:CheY-like chemotaxis protein